MAAVWPGVFVTDDSLTQAVRDVRVALRDEGGKLIQTIRGRGYLLDLPAEPVIDRSGVETVRMPRLAILPFSVAPEVLDTFRIELLREDVAAGLARFRTLNMLSTASARSAASESDNPAVIAARLAADNLIMGSAGPAPGGFLLRLSVTDAAAGTMVWSETFDCTGDALLGATGEIVGRIVGRLHAGLETETVVQAQSRPTVSLTAYDHFAIGYVLYSTDAPEAVKRAHGHFLAATEADPNFAMAWTNLAWAEVAAHEYSAAPPEVLKRALGYARTGVALGPNEGRTHSGLGYIQALAGEYEAAEANVRRGLMLNPSNYEGLLEFVVVTLIRGRPMEALRLLEQARDISPLRGGPEPHLRGEALYMIGRYDEAAAAFQLSYDLPDRRRAFLAATLAMAERNDEATRQMELAASHDPGLGFLDRARASYTYENPADTRHVHDGLHLAESLWRAAGMPGSAQR